MGEGLAQTEEQVVRLNNGTGQVESLFVDLHNPREPLSKVKATIPHSMHFVPTDEGLQVDITAYRSGNIVDLLPRVILQPDDPFILGWERPTQIGDLQLGVMRNMAQVSRHRPEPAQEKLVEVKDFNFDELRLLQKL